MSLVRNDLVAPTDNVGVLLFSVAQSRFFDFVVSCFGLYVVKIPKA